MKLYELWDNLRAGDKIKDEAGNVWEKKEDALYCSGLGIYRGAFTPEFAFDFEFERV